MQKKSRPFFKISFILFLGLATVVSNCSSNKVLKRDNLKEGQTLTLRLSTGEQVKGVLLKSTEAHFIIQDNEGQAWKAPRERVVAVTGPEPVLDRSGKVISEQHIKKESNHKNALLFTISGGVLSLGTGFFLSSMISRAMGDENRDAVIYGGTAAGTALGAFLFSRIGARKDRNQAIERIRQERYQKSVLQERKRKEELEKEINRIREQLEEKK